MLRIAGLTLSVGLLLAATAGAGVAFSPGVPALARIADNRPIPVQQVAATEEQSPATSFVIVPESVFFASFLIYILWLEEFGIRSPELASATFASPVAAGTAGRKPVRASAPASESDGRKILKSRLNWAVGIYR